MKKLQKRLLVLLLLVGILGYAFYWAFYDIQRIKGVEMLATAIAPDGQHIVTTYLTNGGATTSYGVIGEVRNNNTGKSWNIYWQYRCWEAEVDWIDNETVVINGVKLNIHHDKYDFRHQE